MRRTSTAALALLTAAGLAAVPAEAAVKKKPKPITKTYTVTLMPDPTGQAMGEVGADPVDGACSLSPAGQDLRTVTVPAKGTLKVTLEMQNPTGQGQVPGLDWDLFLVDSGGELASSTGIDGREETFTRFKKKQAVTIVACNLTGLPEAKITYTFTYL